MSVTEEHHQLRMVWPKTLLDHPLKLYTPAGYSQRLYRSGDEPQFFDLMASADWAGWDDERLQPWLAKVILESGFMIIHERTDRIFCTAMVLHNYKGSYPFWGELGWLAGDPDHARKNLGVVVSAAVTDRLMNVGYTQIQLFTEDSRLPAIKTYLSLGYIPSLYMDGMEDRWRGICEKLGWTFTPGLWDGSN